jgi:hypothetical protein
MKVFGLPGVTVSIDVGCCARSVAQRVNACRLVPTVLQTERRKFTYRILRIGLSCGDGRAAVGILGIPLSDKLAEHT